MAVTLVLRAPVTLPIHSGGRLRKQPFKRRTTTTLSLLQMTKESNRQWTNTIEIVTDVVEIDGKYCAKNPSFFDTFLEIEFTGTGVTSSEIDIIETNVRAVYNGLRDKTCDLLFRDIDIVSLVLDASTDTTFTLLLLVEAECRDCPVDTTIFENTNQRQLAPSGRYHPWYPKQFDSDCYCPTYEINTGAPTDNAFEVAFRDAVLELNAIGELPNVEDVVNVQEITDGDGVTPRTYSQRFLVRLDLHHAPHLVKILGKEPHLRRLLVPRLQARQAVHPVQALLHRQVHDLAPSQPVLEFRQVSNQAQVQAYRPHNLQMTVQVLLHRDLQANNPVETVEGRQPRTNLHSHQV